MQLSIALASANPKHNNILYFSLFLSYGSCHNDSQTPSRPRSSSDSILQLSYHGAVLAFFPARLCLARTGWRDILRDAGGADAGHRAAE